MLTYRCHVLPPQKTEASRQRFATATWVSHFSCDASPPCELPPAVSASNWSSRLSKPWKREEMPWSFGWFRWGLTNTEISPSEKWIKVQRTHLQGRYFWRKPSCTVKTPSWTKQSANLHGLCWLHFCKEVLDFCKSIENIITHWMPRL